MHKDKRNSRPLFVDLDGTLTVVIGDATGHGMKAGTMVTTTKSLFNVLAPNPDILFTFNEMTRCIKTMELKNLTMCMTLLKLQENRMKISSAGMPPSYIYRSYSNRATLWFESINFTFL